MYDLVIICVTVLCVVQVPLFLFPRKWLFTEHAFNRWGPYLFSIGFQFDPMRSKEMFVNKAFTPFTTILLLLHWLSLFAVLALAVTLEFIT